MKCLRAALLVTSVAWVAAGCEMSLVNLDLQAFPDGSGRLSVMRWAATTDSLDKDDVIKGVVDPYLLRLEVYGGPIEDLSKLKVGEIKASFEARDPGFRLRLDIPTTASSSWYRSLGLTADELRTIEALMELDRMAKGRAELPTELNKDTIDQIPSFVFKVEMPGFVTGSRLLKQDLPGGWYLSHKKEKGEERHSTLLAIPLRDILKPRIEAVVWEIESEALTDERRVQWEENRWDLEQRLKPKKK